MKNKKKEKKLDKASKIAIITTALFFGIGLAALAIGFGIKDGWWAVLSWFWSRWAIYVYIALAILIFILIWAIHKRRMEK